MLKLRTFIKQHIVWVGLLAVVVPLISILYVQYQSLLKLEKTSSVADKVWMRNYLADVGKEVKYFYWTNAEQVLNVPPHVVAGGRLGEWKFPFNKCGEQMEGTSRLFITAFQSGEAETVFYDPASNAVVSTPSPTEVRAASLAIAPLKLLSAEPGATVTKQLMVFEHDHDHRMILKPIVDDDARVVGVAGMFLDVRFFREVYLPRAVRNSLPKFFPDGKDENVVVTVQDDRDEVVFANGPVKKEAEAVLYLPFVFTDWHLSVESRNMTPEQWARRNFNFNLSLSILMTIVLIGGVGLALRTVSREMKLSQMKTDFVSNVSHELRTPLSSIRVFGEFMKLGRVREGEKMREYGEHIETESRRLTQLINNILDFSKIESGRKTYKFERVSLEEVVAETLKTCEVRLKQNDFRIVYEAPHAPLPPTVLDREAVSQALVNLLDNAVKYSETSGDKRVVVRTGREDGSLTVSVRDFGVGIARKEQSKIFEKFYRVGTGLVHDVKGSGLGLALVKHIVESHGGSVRVESDLGRGSTFTICLPIRRADDATDDEAAPRPAGFDKDLALAMGVRTDVQQHSHHVPLNLPD